MKNIDLAQKELQEMLKRLNLKLGYKLDFPMYRELPAEVRLALEILERHKMRVGILFKEKKEK